jgi:VCBS repeat-containing protein
MRRLLIGMAVLACASQASLAQTTASPYAGGAANGGDGNASIMWGTNGGSLLGGAQDTGAFHELNGAAAAQVNAARRGYLLPDNITIQSIGSQNIVSITISGSGNAASVKADQSSSNSGSITNSGVVNAQ